VIEMTPGNSIADQGGSLDREARHLHGCLFGFPPAEDIIIQYRLAHRFLPLPASPAMRRSVDRIVNMKLDAEAVELALRRQVPRHLLCQKLHVLCYLAEARSAYYPRFVNEDAAFLKACCCLGLHTIRSLFKRLKGEYLIRRHAIV